MGKSKESFNDYVRKVRNYLDYWTCSFRESGLSKLETQLFTTVPERRGTGSILRNFRDRRTAAAHWESGDTKWNRRTWLTVAWRFVTSQAMCTPRRETADPHVGPADKLLCFDGQEPQPSGQSTSISTTGLAIHSSWCSTYTHPFCRVHETRNCEVHEIIGILE